MKANTFQVIKSSTNILKDYKKKEITSQILFGETFVFSKQTKCFIYGLNLTDNYEGWVCSSDLGILPEFNFYVSEIRVNLLSKPEIKSEFIKYLPMRAKIKVINIDKNKVWAKMQLPKSCRFKFGYVPFNQILDKTKYEDDWVFFAEKFIGTPYRWGGRDSLGIDCSSLVQLSLAFNGYYIPRDTCDQINYFCKHENFIVKRNVYPKIERGSIIFWDGHVAVAINDDTIIHASAHHKKVVYESLNEAIRRINSNISIVKKNIKGEYGT